MKCCMCEYEIQKYEHYVIRNENTYCENCFWDIAIINLEAKEMQKGYEEDGD